MAWLKEDDFHGNKDVVTTAAVVVVAADVADADSSRADGYLKQMSL